jgi:hypothetical protein
MQHNLSANTDAQMRPLPSVAPGFVRRLPLLQGLPSLSSNRTSR